MSGFFSREDNSGSGISSRPRRAITESFDRDPIETGSAIRITPPGREPVVKLSPSSVLHVAAQFLIEGRAQAAEYAANASAAIREVLASARARRFEAVQQAKARRIMLESYRSALMQQAQAQKVLGPHVRFSGSTGKNLWIFFFLIGDCAALTLALTYGGESPIVASIMSVAVGAAVVVIGKTGEDLRRESLTKSMIADGDSEMNRIVEAVFNTRELSNSLNHRVTWVLMSASMLSGIAVLVYRTTEENFGVGMSFGLWSTLVAAGSFAASWYYCDPAKTFISLTQQAVEDARDIWRSTPIDAIEEHNASIEAARHIVAEHQRRADSAWYLALAGAAAVMNANSDVIGVAQEDGHWLLNQSTPELQWPDLTAYVDIVDPDDVLPDEFGEVGEGFPIFMDDVTNQIRRPQLSPQSFDLSS